MTRRIHTLKSDGPWEYPCRASRSRSLTVSLLAGAESEATLQSARLLPPAPPSSAPLEIFNWSFWGSAKMISGEMRVTAPYSVEAHFQTLDSRTRRAALGLRRFFGATRQQRHFVTSSPPVPGQGRIVPRAYQTCINGRWGPDSASVSVIILLPSSLSGRHAWSEETGVCLCIRYFCIDHIWRHGAELEPPDIRKQTSNCQKQLDFRCFPFRRYPTTIRHR